MPNLDRFSQPMFREWEPEASGPTEIEYQEPIKCACGCGLEIDLDDTDSFIESDIWEDDYILHEPEHLNMYSKQNDQLVGSQPR